MISFLPTLNALLNFSSAVLLCCGFYFIKKKNRVLHRRCMLAALTVTALFLISYVTYHYHVGSVKFQGQGFVRTAYFTILTSHTILAITIVPMVIITLRRALTSRFEKHRRLARWTLPLWLYVSLTGVLIYFFLYVWFPGNAAG